MHHRVLTFLLVGWLFVSCARDASAPAAGSAATALATLNTLAIKGRAPKTGYSRRAFGAAWTDVDHNGCDTRNDILNRDVRVSAWKPNTRACVVIAGQLNDPYTGRSVEFVKVRADRVQIDHVVALSDAWQKGAFSWPPKTRVAFANDPRNLLAVDGQSNQAKGDGDAATWLPPNRKFRCSYVARQIAVKAAYNIWVTRAERDAMARILHRCPVASRRFTTRRVGP